MSKVYAVFEDEVSERGLLEAGALPLSREELRLPALFVSAKHTPGHR